MKRFLILFVLVLIIPFFSCFLEPDEMQAAQQQKEELARIKGLHRTVKVYENGNLIEEMTGFYNLEINQYNKVVTLTETKGLESVYVHKFLPSENTFISICETTNN